jgi:hypothetical protein
MAAFVGRAPVTGDPFALREEFHDGGTEADVELLAHQGVGHGVVVPFHLDVVIDVDPGELPLCVLVGLWREGPERRAVERIKQLLA